MRTDTKQLRELYDEYFDPSTTKYRKDVIAERFTSLRCAMYLKKTFPPKYRSTNKTLLDKLEPYDTAIPKLITGRLIELQNRADYSGLHDSVISFIKTNKTPPPEELFGKYQNYMDNLQKQITEAQPEGTQKQTTEAQLEDIQKQFFTPEQWGTLQRLVTQRNQVFKKFKGQKHGAFNRGPVPAMSDSKQTTWNTNTPSLKKASDKAQSDVTTTTTPNQATFKMK